MAKIRSRIDRSFAKDWLIVFQVKTTSYKKRFLHCSHADSRIAEEFVKGQSEWVLRPLQLKYRGYKQLWTSLGQKYDDLQSRRGQSHEYFSVSLNFSTEFFKTHFLKLDLSHWGWDWRDAIFGQIKLLQWSWIFSSENTFFFSKIEFITYFIKGFGIFKIQVGRNHQWTQRRTLDFIGNQVYFDWFHGVQRKYQPVLHHQVGNSQKLVQFQNKNLIFFKAGFWILCNRRRFSNKRFQDCQTVEICDTNRLFHACMRIDFLWLRRLLHRWRGFGD